MRFPLADYPTRIRGMRMTYSPGLIGDLSAAALSATVGALPVFLVAATSVQLEAQLHFGAEGLGLTVAVNFFSAALFQILLARAVEAVGGLRVMRLSCFATSIVLVLFPIVATSFTVILVLMVPAGLISAAVQPAANFFIARRIPVRHQGLAYGTKQAAVPLSALLGGLSVPFIALTIGWKWAFAGLGLLAAVAGVLLPRPRMSLADFRASRPASGLRRGQLLPLVALACAFGLGVASATSLAGFLADASVASGVSKANAGLLVALGAGIAAASRIVTGLRADARGRAHLPVVFLMQVTGAGGYMLLASDSARHSTLLLLSGVFLAYAAGWGWNGLLTFAAVRSVPEHPAQASAIAQTGGRVGGFVGPLLFGIAVVHFSYGFAWICAAISATAGACAVLIARRMLTAH